MWNKVKTEIDRSRKRLTERKDKKLTRLREEKQREGDYDVDLIDLNIDIENSKKSSKDFRKRNGGKTRRKRNSHRKRIKTTNNKRRGEKRKAEYREFVEKMDNVSRRKPVEMTNIKDRTDYQFSDSDIDLCGKGQKFVPKPMRIDLIKKQEDFISFSRKMRLKIYFDNRNRDYSSESNMDSEASGGEEPPISYEGHHTMGKT